MIAGAKVLALFSALPLVAESAGLRSRVLRQSNEVATVTAANPIRKVVTLLQDMQKKVTEEGKHEQELYDKFMCYCQKNEGSLSQGISEAEAKIDATSSALKAATENKAQTEADLKEHQQSRADAKDTMAKATALREKEAREFSKVKSDLDTNIAALTKAVNALEKGVAGTFLQTPAAGLIKRYVMEKATLQDGTREELLSFLSGTQREGYMPQSGEIIGILKQLGDEMKQSLADATNEENNAIQNYEELMAAKKKELEALQSQIEQEMDRIGRLGVSIAEMGNDIENTQQSLAADQQFKRELAGNCETKTAEWEEIKKNRADELVAIAETIKVLNDDDALELFKKTLPSASASFVQMKVSSDKLRARALSIIRKSAAASRNPGLDLISLALRGKQVGFDKVIKMIDTMVQTLHQEQVDDDAKLEYCNGQLDQSDDRRKALEQAIADSETAIAQAEGDMATLAEEIKSLQAGIKDLDKAVAEATEQRKAENADYKELVANDSAAKEVLLWAKNRLNKFYNKALYKAPPKRELSEDERIAVNMGGTVAPEPAAGGIAGTGIEAFVQISQHRAADEPEAPPAAPGAYKKKSQASNGVIAMIDLLIKDLDKEMQEAGVSERDSQADYEKTMADAAAKRAADVKATTEKAGAKASAEEFLQAEKEKHGAASKELMGTMKYIQSLHAECDWLMKYHEARKTARADEVDALKNAKAVLKGADFALVQTSAQMH